MQRLVGVPVIPGIAQVREDAGALAAWLGELRGGKVRVGWRPRGAEAALLRMAEENAADYFNRRLADVVLRQEKLDKLQRRLQLRCLPRRIECVDLSTSGGMASVGAVAVMNDGEPEPSQYRRYKIRQAAPDQDLAMMAEVVERRLTRLLREGKPLPDLLLLDGGAAHLKAVEAVLKRLSLELELAGGYLTAAAAELRRIALEQDVLLRPLGPVAYAMPPLGISRQSLERIAATFERLIDHVATV